MAIFKRIIASQGARPLSTITAPDIEAKLAVKGGNAAVNELKAIKPVFKHAAKLRFIRRDPTLGIKIERPETIGFPTANADDIAKFQKRWPVGTTERLVFDLALFSGAARIDLTHLGRKHIEGKILAFTRHKTGVETLVPITRELRAVIAQAPDIAPTFILSEHGKPYTKESLGNRFREAAVAAGVGFRLHGLRKAFCVYWAEQGKSAHQIATMAGHLTLGEVERYTRDADRRRMIQLLVEGS